MTEYREEIAMIKASRIRVPDPERAGHTVAGGEAAFEKLAAEAARDPDGFWAKAASELDWIQPWHTIRRGALPHFEYFVGGLANPCSNMVDRHVRAGAGNRLALIWESETGESKCFSYRMLSCEINRFSNVLKRIGLGKGDTVAIFLPNLPETVIAVLACFRLGIVFNTIFSGFSPASLRNRLEGFLPKAIITADAVFRRGKLVPLKEKVDEAISGINGLDAVVVVKRTGTPVTMRSGRDYWWEDLIQGASIDCPAEPMEANDPAIVFYTSGTSGKPKGVVHAGMGFLINAYTYAKYQLDHRSSDIFWCTADVGWLTMHIWGIVGSLSNGVTTIFYDGALDWPSPDRFYQVLSKYRVNKLMTAPTAIRGLMRHGEVLRAPYDLSELDTICVLGEPLNAEAWHWIDKHLGQGHIYINNMWGQTELGGTPLCGAAWLTSTKPGSCGREFLAANLDVVDDEGKSLPQNVAGHLVVRAPFPAMVRGLWNEPERFVSEYFTRIPGCYCTYDSAVRDEDGHFWVLGRTDDVINVAGHRLSTMEMECAILTCESVAEAAVTGMPDALKGLVPVAFVVLRSNCHPTETLRAEIRQRVEAVIGKLAVPGEIHFCDNLPKTASGKIMRRLLKEIAVNGTVQGDVTGLEDATVVEKIKHDLEPDPPPLH